jgi:hypothetical protein
MPITALVIPRNFFPPPEFETMNHETNFFNSDGEFAGGAGFNSGTQGTTTCDFAASYNCDWTQEGGGSGSSFYDFQSISTSYSGGTSSYMATKSTQMNNPPSASLGQAMGTDSGDGITSQSYDPSWTGVCGSWPYSVANAWEAPVWWEHCGVTMLYPMGQPGRWRGSEFGYTTGIYGRTADAVVKLRTGGKATSRRRNLFCLTAVAAEVENKMSYSYAWLYYYWQVSGPAGTVPIPAQSITIMGQALDINSNVYVVLPDNQDIDVTPRVQNKDFYTFNVDKQKYLSHFEVFVCQPYPDWPNDLKYYDPIYNPIPIGYPFWNSSVNAGHAWWKLTTDAPTDAVNKFANTNASQWLGQEVGYGPTSLTWSLQGCSIEITGPGELPFPYQHAWTVHRIYAVGFQGPGVIEGLNHTEHVHNYPGTWDSRWHNCVQEAFITGNASGAGLPISDWLPEFFGFDVSPDSP